MTRKIQHKRGLEANLPQLDVAEIAFTTDSKKPFIGSADGNVEIAKKADVDEKASKTELTNAVSPKADKTYVDTELGKKASTDEVSAVSAQLAETKTVIDEDTGERVIYDLSKQDGKVFMTLKKDEITLDTIVHEDVTLGDLFTTHNLIPNSHFNNDLNDFIVSVGNPAVSSSIFYTPSKSLKVAGTSSQQIAINLFYESKRVFTAMKARLDRYTSGGGIGYQFTGGAEGTIIYKHATPDGKFRTLSSINTTTAKSNVIAGTIQSANADGYIDDFVAVDLSVFTEEPSLTQLTEWYEAYLLLLKGETPFRTNEQFLAGEYHKSFIPAEAYNRFVEEMNDKAKKIGMNQTNFVNPHGLHMNGHYSTARDLVYMGINAAGYGELARVWGKQSYTFRTKGVNPRDITISSTVQNAALNNYYHIFGGKTGTANYKENLLTVVNAPNNDWFIGVVLDSTGGRFGAARQLYDVANTILEDGTVISQENMVSNGDFNNGLEGWSTQAGTPTVNTDGTLNVNSAGTSSQVSQHLPAIEGHRYYISTKVNVTRYVKGAAGFQFNGATTGVIGKTSVTNGWEKLSGIYTGTMTQTALLYVGAFTSADLDANVDDVVVYDLTEIFGAGNEPTLEEFEAMDMGIVNASKAAVSLMPKHHPWAYENYEVPLVYAKKADVQEVPASITKVMTAMVMLDHVPNLDESINITHYDLATAGNINPTFEAGDVLTFKDALYCMMLPSSNIAASAVARTVGERILRAE